MGYETSLQLFIDGVWKSGEGRDSHQVVNPVDAKPIADLPYATRADLDEALAGPRERRNRDRARLVERPACHQMSVPKGRPEEPTAPPRGAASNAFS